ncbi:7TM diverse intracellular signaling domain-containing protein [Pseudotenacibaculum sp. MALMAid0570]|uniref:7TM diverse intracellular signaling domain-containing protein n=1 Tax=Pseudotenacibaculum sp. MALMAid0570 TaxID=3143938 RepID=UPI0032E03F9B
MPVINGLLDLSNQDIKSSQTIDLDGSWLFHWNQIPINEKGEFDLSQLKKRDSIYLSAGTWKDSVRPTKGFGMYYLKIILPKDTVCRQLKIPRINSAAKVFFFGRFNKELGQFSTVEKDARGDGRPLYIDVGCDGTAYIVLLVSNYHYASSGGISYGVHISSSKRMTVQKNFLQIAQPLFALLILLIALYHIFLFFNYKNKLLLYFALFSVFLSLRQFFIGEVTIYVLFPDMSFDLILLFRGLLLYLGTLFFILFFKHLLPSKALNLIVGSMIIVYSLSLIIMLLNKTYELSYVSLINLYVLLGTVTYITYLIIRGNLKKLKSQLVTIIASVFGLIFLSADLLYSQKGINIDLLLIFIVFCFLSLQIIMSYIYWKNNIKRIKNLSSEVEELNETITIGKEERTILLSESIQQLQSKQSLVKRLVNIKNNKTPENLNGIIAELKSTKLEESRKIILKQNIEELNFEFLRNLKLKHNDLTETDIEICSLMMLGFSSKEICNLRSTTIFALKSSRYRLRKKFNLSPEESLKEYLKNI